MVSTWAKNIQWITWIRIGVALLTILLALDWVIVLGDDMMGFSLLIPLTYMYAFDVTSTANISVLVIPILVNIALWVPCMQSYLFLRVVLYAEYIKYIVVLPFLTMVLPFSPLFQRNNPAKTFFVVVVLLFITWELSSNLKKDKCKEYFKVNKKNSVELDRSLVKMGMAFILAILLANAVEYYAEGNLFRENVKAEIHDFNNIKSNRDLAEILKVSRDESKFLMRRALDGSSELSTYVYDAKSMKTIQVLRTPAAKKASSTAAGCAFTPDGRYVVIGDHLSPNDKVIFRVYDIATGERDNRFSDPRGVLNQAKVGISDQDNVIEFNNTGSYFIVGSRGSYQLAVWDYKKGTPIYAEVLPSSLRASNLVWLGERKFLVAYSLVNHSHEKVVYQYEILPDNSIKKVKKELLSKEIVPKNSSSFNIVSSHNKEYIANFISVETPINNMGIVNIWQVENEQKISTIKIVTTIQDIVFHPDNKRILVLELAAENASKISVWNILSGKKEKELFVARDYKTMVYSGYYGTNRIRVLDNGKKIMLIGKSVGFIDFKY